MTKINLVYDKYNCSDCEVSEVKYNNSFNIKFDTVDEQLHLSLDEKRFTDLFNQMKKIVEDYELNV